MRGFGRVFGFFGGASGCFCGKILRGVLGVCFLGGGGGEVLQGVWGLFLVLRLLQEACGTHRRRRDILGRLRGAPRYPKP